MRVYVKTLFVVSLMVLFNYFLAFHQVLTIPEHVLNTFFNLFGVLYAIIIGFAIYLVLDDYEEIKHYMQDEVNEIQDLRDYLMYVDNQEDLVKEIRGKIKVYVEMIVKKDWPAMCGSKKINMDTPPEAYDIMKSINKIRVTDPSDSIALEKLMECLAKATDYRSDRLIASRERLPALIRHVIVILSLFLVITFSFIPIQDLRINLGLNALNSFGISLIYFVITDLDYPFGGVWRITSEEFEDLSKSL